MRTFPCIHTFPQDTFSPHGQDTTRRFGVWDCGPGHQRTLGAIILAGRTHVIAESAVQFAPQVDIAHVFTMTVPHVIAHSVSSLRNKRSGLSAFGTAVSPI